MNRLATGALAPPAVPPPSLDDLLSVDWFHYSILKPENARAIGLAAQHILAPPEETNDLDGSANCAGNCMLSAKQKKEEEEEAERIHDNVEDYEGRDYDEVEAEFDKKLRDDAGWTKKPLRDGNGSRYTSPNGNRQIRLNKGYPSSNSYGPSDEIHRGPYLGKPSTETRIPLKRL